MSGLIDARSSRDPRLVARLTARASKLARAYAESRYRARRGDGWRWRKARLLWPLTGSED